MKRTLSLAVAFSLLSIVARAQTTLRVSIDSAGAEANSNSYDSSLSADGRYVAFWSYATNLVPGDTNLARDVFVRDLQTGQTTRVSVDSIGAEGNGLSDAPRISADGRFVAFASEASNLVTGDMNGVADIFVHDRVTGQTTLESVDSAGVQSDFLSSAPAISADGRHVAFQSWATNFTPNDTNAVPDVFVHDRQTGTTTLVSVGLLGEHGNAISDMCSISGDGRYVAFRSGASNLVTGDLYGYFDIFVRDVQAGQTQRVSIDPGGVPFFASSNGSSISLDGRYVAFDRSQTYVRDLQLGLTTLASVNSAGVQGNGHSIHPSISADGRFVAFESRATNFVVGDTNFNHLFGDDVFLRDRQTGQTTRINLNSTGAQGNNGARNAAISADGHLVAFESPATNLVYGDTNDMGLSEFMGVDVFVRDPLGATPFAGFCFGDSTLPTACPCAPPDSVPNPSAAQGYGCANSFSSDGAMLAVSGSLAPDSVVLSANVGSNYVGFGLLIKGDARDTNGFANGDGVRCVDGALIRFGSHYAGSEGAPAGVWVYPNSTQTTPVSVATLQGAAQSAWYQLLYRNAKVGFCSPGTTNWTNGIRISWP